MSYSMVTDHTHSLQIMSTKTSIFSVPLSLCQSTSVGSRALDLKPVAEKPQHAPTNQDAAGERVHEYLACCAHHITSTPLLSPISELIHRTEGVHFDSLSVLFGGLMLLQHSISDWLGHRSVNSISSLSADSRALVNYTALSDTDLCFTGRVCQVEQRVFLMRFPKQVFSLPAWPNAEGSHTISSQSDRTILVPPTSYSDSHSLSFPCLSFFLFPITAFSAFVAAEQAQTQKVHTLLAANDTLRKQLAQAKREGKDNVRVKQIKKLRAELVEQEHFIEALKRELTNRGVTTEEVGDMYFSCVSFCRG